MKVRNYLILGLALANMCMLISCSQDDAVESPLGIEEEAITRAVTDTLIAKGLLGRYSVGGFNDYYVDAPGNLYCVYSKAYLDMVDLSGVFHELNQYLYNNLGFSLDIAGRPTRGFCIDLNENVYYITSMNRLVKLDRAGQFWDLTDRFPENTVFLGITTAQVNANVFVATAQGDGSDNPWKSFYRQTVYRVSANRRVTMIADNIYAPVVPNDPYILTYGDSSSEYSVSTYTSVLSKRQGAYLFGMEASGKYHMINTNTGKVTYYTPKVPIQFLVAGSSNTRAIGLSGRRILELYPNAARDVVIGVLPSTIPEDAEIVNFLTNADATVFYVVVLENRPWHNTYAITPIVYSLRVNN